jgi:hypothetical protein
MFWLWTKGYGPEGTTDLPHCGAYLTLALPLGGTGKRTFQCLDCDGPDPLKTEKVVGWLNGELRPPE